MLSTVNHRYYSFFSGAAKFGLLFVVHCIVCLFVCLPIHFGFDFQNVSDDVKLWENILFENYIVCPTHSVRSRCAALKCCVLWTIHSTLHTPHIVHISFMKLYENCPNYDQFFFLYLIHKCSVSVGVECKISNLKGPKTTGMVSLFYDYHCVFCGR